MPDNLAVEQVSSSNNFETEILFRTYIYAVFHVYLFHHGNFESLCTGLELILYLQLSQRTIIILFLSKEVCNVCQAGNENDCSLSLTNQYTVIEGFKLSFFK